MNWLLELVTLAHLHQNKYSLLFLLLLLLLLLQSSARITTNCAIIARSSAKPQDFFAREILHKMFLAFYQGEKLFQA